MIISLRIRSRWRSMRISRCAAGRLTVEASHGVIQLRGVAASTTEAQRAVQIAQGIKGVKEVRNRLTVQ